VGQGQCVPTRSMGTRLDDLAATAARRKLRISARQWRSPLPEKEGERQGNCFICSHPFTFWKEVARCLKWLERRLLGEHPLLGDLSPRLAIRCWFLQPGACPTLTKSGDEWPRFGEADCPHPRPLSQRARGGFGYTLQSMGCWSTFCASSNLLRFTSSCRGWARGFAPRRFWNAVSFCRLSSVG
jgi:hypothetical protein